MELNGKIRAQVSLGDDYIFYFHSCKILEDIKKCNSETNIAVRQYYTAE